MLRNVVAMLAQGGRGLAAAGGTAEEGFAPGAPQNGRRRVRPGLTATSIPEESLSDAGGHALQQGWRPVESVGLSGLLSGAYEPPTSPKRHSLNVGLGSVAR